MNSILKKIIAIAALTVCCFLAQGFLSQAQAATSKTITITADSNRSDDTSVIQNALNKAKRQKGTTVHIKPGSYTISGTLTIYSNTTLKLDKGATITRSNIGCAMLKSCINKSKGGYSQAKNITVSGGVWNGNAKNGKKSTSNIMAFYHGQNITIKNCTVKGVTCKHMVTLAGVKNCTVLNVTFKNQYAYNGSDIKSFYNDHTDAEYIDLFKGSCEVLHLDVINSSGVSEPSAYPLDDTVNKNITVKNCTFKNVIAGIGNHIPLKYAGGYSTGLTVKGNTFKGVKYYALNIYGQKDAVIKNNQTVSKVRGFARVVDSKNITIKGNYITLKGRKKSPSYYFAAVYTEFGTNVLVKNNTIITHSAYGIVDYGDVNNETYTSTVTEHGNTVVKSRKKLNKIKTQIELVEPWKYLLMH